MKEVVIYTDGACSGNPGPGGWGVVMMYQDHRKELSGYAAHTTNNRMEITAAIEGLKLLREPCAVKIYSDSSYLVNTFEKGWIYSWMKNHWLKSDKKPVENQDLWQELLSLIGIHQVKWIKVKGHSSNKENNRCDAMATGEIKQRRASSAL